MAIRIFAVILASVPIDRTQLPEDASVLQQIVLDLIEQLDASESKRIKTEQLLRQLLAAKTGRKSEQLSREQLALFAEELKAQGVNLPEEASGDDEDDNVPPSTGGPNTARPHGRRPMPEDLKRERIVHDLAEAEKHCPACAQELRLIGEESSERYEYIPAQMIVIEEVCKKYACNCTVKTATKPAQPIEKSTAGAGLLTHVIVSKYADHRVPRTHHQ